MPNNIHFSPADYAVYVKKLKPLLKRTDLARGSSQESRRLVHLLRQYEMCSAAHHTSSMLKVMLRLDLFLGGFREINSVTPR